MSENPTHRRSHAEEPVQGDQQADVPAVDQPESAQPTATPVEPSRYSLAHLIAPRVDGAHPAEAFPDSTPGELRAALHGRDQDLFTADEVRAAINEWRQRPIPAY